MRGGMRVAGSVLASLPFPLIVALIDVDGVDVDFLGAEAGPTVSTEVDSYSIPSNKPSEDVVSLRGDERMIRVFRGEG
jgi:hypothetical protein